MTLLIMLAEPDVSRKTFSELSDKPSRKKSERSGSLSGSLSHDEIWLEFQSFMVSHSAAADSSSSSHSHSLRGHHCCSSADSSRPCSFLACSARHWSPRRDCPASVACLAQPSLPARPAHPASLT